MWRYGDGGLRECCSDCMMVMCMLLVCIMLQLYGVIFQWLYSYVAVVMLCCSGCVVVVVMLCIMLQ